MMPYLELMSSPPRFITSGILRFKTMSLEYGDNSHYTLKTFFASLVVTHHINDGFDRLDIGTSEPLILDVLINALTQISSE